ncbi:hypothetical protein FOCC_FOCC014345, partial [Frankliniella occidentalis]
MAHLMELIEGTCPSQAPAAVISFPFRSIGRERYRRIPPVENAVLLRVTLNAHTSTRTAAADVGVSHMTVNRILRGHGLHPFKIGHHQALKPGDPPRRYAMCEWFLDRIENVENPGDDPFLASVLFSDECTFRSDGGVNRHNAHHYSGENPHSFQPNHVQGGFNVTVWAVGDQVIGPYFWPDNVTAEEYGNLLNYELPDMLDEVPLEIRRRMWFMQDGHPAHTSLLARGLLNRDYPG